MRSQRQETEEKLHQIETIHKKDLDRVKTETLFEYRDWLETSEKSKKSLASENKPLSKFLEDVDNGFLSTASGRQIPRRRTISIESSTQTSVHIDTTTNTTSHLNEVIWRLISS